jgi:hypothetical protein
MIRVSGRQSFLGKSSAHFIVQACSRILLGSYGCFLFWFLLLAPQARADEKEWVIRQVSPDSGTHTTYVCSSSIKIVNETKKIVIVMRKPNWHVVAYNESMKTVYQAPIGKWKGYSFHETAFFSTRFSALVKTKSEVVNLRGLICNELTLRADHPSIPVAARNIDVAVLTVDECEQFALPPDVCRVVAGEFYLPPTNGLPISASYVSVFHLATEELQLVSCKSKPFSEADFKLPERLTTVSSAEELWRKKPQVNDFYEMIK